MANTAKTLNEVFSSLSARRRYEVWFLRLGLADGNGAWWIRYLLMNPGRSGCSRDPQGLPVQVWATWFPAGGQPRTFIRGFSLDHLDLSPRGQSPFHLRVGDNEIGEDFCRGALDVDGHTISWDLGYASSFRVTLSAKGWIGFSRTPHSDARFPGASRSTGGASRVALSDLESRDTIVATAIESSGPGRTRILLKTMGRRVRSRPCSTTCHWAWSFERQCCGMVAKDM